MHLEIRSRRLAVMPKITVAEISQISGVSKSGIQKLEKGHVNNPGIKTVSAVETALAQLEAQRATVTTP